MEQRLSLAFTTYQAGKVSESDVADDWRDNRRDGGCVIDVAANQVIVRRTKRGWMFCSPVPARNRWRCHRSHLRRVLLG